MQTLDKFIANQNRPWSAWVLHPDFSSLYVRKTRIFINHELTPNFITIANITAKRKGKGAFRRLVAYLMEERGFNVQVECIQNPRLEQHLLKEGWLYQYKREPWPPCMYKLACNTALQAAT